MRRGWRWAVLIVVAGLAIAALVFRPDRALKVATGLSSQILCNAVFVSGLDPETVFAETVRPLASIAGPLISTTVDRERGEVSSAIFGLLRSTATFREGYGCRLVHEGDASLPSLPPQPPAPSEAAFTTTDPGLITALDTLFAESPGETPRYVKAVLAVKDGRVIAERYAPGYGPNQPLPSFSVAKSVTNALAGILVREGRLSLSAPTPIPAWQGAEDPRRTITLEHLLRMTSGLDMAQDGSGFDAASQMVYTAGDMAAVAAASSPAHAPGTVFAYTDCSTLLVSALIRQAVGEPDALVAFAALELFAPLGIRRMTMEFDGAGTQVGAIGMSATARDWARLGQLYLDDGIAADGRRILPEGWVAMTRTPTLGSLYGAGFWTTLGEGEDAKGVVARGMPPGTFFASGNLGQRIYIVPSENLVLVRLGVSFGERNGLDADLTFLNAVIARSHDPALPIGPSLNTIALGAP